MVNALSEESVGQNNHGMEPNPTTDSSLKPARGECSPASRSPRAGFSDLSLSGHQWCPRWENPSAKTVEISDGRRCYNSHPGEHHFTDVYGDSRDGAIARAKVVLNLHFYESRIFEIVRVSYLTANGVAVVTEDSVDIPEDLRRGLAIVPYGALVEACRGIVDSPERRRELERTGFACFSQRREEEILRAVIA